MPKQYVPILQPNYNKKDMFGASATRLVNFYLEQFPQAIQNRPNIAALYTPGISLFHDFTGASVRNLFEWKGDGYAVVNATVYKITDIDTTPIFTSIGTMNTSTGRISVTATIAEIVWCDGTDVYKYDGTTFTVFTAEFNTNITPDVVPIFVTSKDGFVIYCTDTDSSVYVSALLDAGSVAALSTFQTNSSYDPLVSAIASNVYIYFFGTQTTEIWYDAGTAIQPLARTSNGVVQYGIVAPHSATVIADNVYFLAQSDKGILGIMAMNGTQTQVISTPDFVSKVVSYEQVDDAFAWVDVHDGHTFYNITFPNSEMLIPGVNRGRTWSIDITTGFMFERQSYDPAIRMQSRHIANCQMSVGQTQFVGAFNSGELYVISKDYYDDDGEEIQRLIVGPHLKDRDLFISVYSVEIDLERGIGIDGEGQGDDPQLILQVSKDEGRSWGNMLFRRIGAIGEYKPRIRFGSLGGSRSMTIRIQVSDPIPWAIYSVTAEVEKGETN